MVEITHKDIYMENENKYTMLIDIRIKMSAGLTLTEPEQHLWDEWINRPDVKERQFYDKKDIDVCILISSRNQSFDEFLKEMEKREKLHVNQGIPESIDPTKCEDW